MALSTQIASSPSLSWAEPPPRRKYDVFLSFRGEDTRWGFISHLDHQLEFCQVFKTFKDDRELEIGSEISPKLLTAVEHSHLAIVVLSPNYASSTWCLDELAKIIEFMEPGDKRVLPVFLNVDPSDVRHQRNSFTEAFAKHEVKFSDDPKKVERWRHALRKVANLSGWDAKNYKCERELTDVIVKSVWEKLRPTITLSNSEEKKSRGKLVNLQKQVLFPVLKENVSQVWDEYKGTFFIRRCLSNKKVLLVVDDVDSCDLLKQLAGHKSWFGEGSRIIVTTRDERVLIENDIEISFKLSGRNECEALELFCQNAFKKDLPVEGFSELSKCFINYVEGLPLGLKIVGSSLYNRDLETWESAWDRLKKGSDAKIFNSLKISYDALDYMEKNIFLDVAFFYKGMNKGRVIELLKSCDFSARYGIEVLIEKSLITIDVVDNVEMHGLIQEMAQEIVRLETQEPGLRSRLLHRNDIFHVFTANTGIEAIKGIRLSLSELEEADSNWNFECFSKMLKLMFLEFDNLIVSSGPKSLPNSLIILRWSWYPSKSLPACFRPNSLVELKMQNSQLVKLWDGRQELPNLKHLDLGDSNNLKKTPDFTVHKKLKLLTLYGCKNVKSFPSKIEMDSLKFLDLSYCSKLKIPEFGEGMENLCHLIIPGTATEELPSSIEHMVGLEVLDMSRCPKLKKLVENTGEIECLKPSMRSKLGSLFRRKSLEPSLPSPRAFPSLWSLELADCHLSQGVIPDDIGYCFPSLYGLRLDGNDFITLPASIKCLSKLAAINLTGCKRLQQLPDLPSNWYLQVWADDCDSLKKLSEPSQQGTSSNLVGFRLSTVNCFGLIDSEGFTNGIFSMLRRLASQGISRDFLSYSCTVRPSFDILSPGSRISEWFDIRSEGGSLTVELPPDRKNCKSKWMGIVFCVVFADLKEPHTLENDEFVIEGLSPAVGVKHIHDSKKHFMHLTNTKRHMKGDHLWVSFMPRGQIRDTTSCSFTFSFDAYCDSWRHPRIPCPNCVKRCGARLLYKEDLKNLLNPPTDIMKRSLELCDSEGGRSKRRRSE
uniref:TMV resistance protein N-like isoform X2 n=1 Tax=Fragaria vesca subsp. vesca TaxID=101020 RepID=UPI0005CAFF5D|nr:PREDICTED: TMV resistance protein N-like isoform X2 [Fragaria vesca subsp. vesca]